MGKGFSRSEEARSAGRLGGRPRKQRIIPPPEQALPPRKHRGPRPKCTPELIVKFASVYARCGRVDDAAAICGVTPSAVTVWFTLAEQGREPYRTLVAQAKEANAAAVVEAEEYMRMHVEWRAREAWLNRVRPIRENVRVELTGKDGADLIPEDRLRAAIVEAARRLSGGKVGGEDVE